MSLSPFPQLTDEHFLDKLKRKHVSFSYCPTTQILEVLAEAKLRHLQNEVAELKASLAEETKKRGVLLRSSLTCPICMEENLEKPVAMDCGHVLCETCHFGIKGICPLCREKSEYYCKLFVS